MSHITVTQNDEDDVNRLAGHPYNQLSEADKDLVLQLVQRGLIGPVTKSNGIYYVGQSLLSQQA